MDTKSHVSPAASASSAWSGMIRPTATTGTRTAAFTVFA